MAKSFSYDPADGVHERFQGLLQNHGPSRSPHAPQDSQFHEEARSEESQALKRKFLRRLAVALVTYGSSAPRAEYLIDQAAERLNENVNIGVFASVILLVFPSTGDTSWHETHLDRVQSDSDVAKLQQTDELANSVGLPCTPLSTAWRQLSSIGAVESPFGPWSMLLGYTITAPTAAFLFFNGGVWDAVFSLLLGLGVGLLALNASGVPALESTEKFLSAIFVSFASRVITVYFEHLDVCYFTMAMSGLTWLLPGEDLTIGVSEVVETSLVSGISRIARALVASLQLGFGLAIGEKMVFWSHEPFDRKCTPSQLSQWWGVIWFLGFSIAVNVLLKARPWQWPGMTLAAGAGVLVDNLTGSFGLELSAVASSFAIGVTGTLCSYFSRDIPLSMILAGIQVILPGELGVQGVEALLKHDVLSGMEFVTSMINISLSITLGLLMSKVFVRNTEAGFGTIFKHSKSIIAPSTLQEETWDDLKENGEEEEEEQMAI